MQQLTTVFWFYCKFYPSGGRALFPIRAECLSQLKHNVTNHFEPQTLSCFGAQRAGESAASLVRATILKTIGKTKRDLERDYIMAATSKRGSAPVERDINY